jgi:hypothetical protein
LHGLFHFAKSLVIITRTRATPFVEQRGPWSGKRSRRAGAQRSQAARFLRSVFHRCKSGQRCFTLFLCWICVGRTSCPSHPVQSWLPSVPCLGG